jgi:hypothetical protein
VSAYPFGQFEPHPLAALVVPVFPPLSVPYFGIFGLNRIVFVGNRRRQRSISDDGLKNAAKLLSLGRRESSDVVQGDWCRRMLVTHHRAACQFDFAFLAKLIGRATAQQPHSDSWVDDAFLPDMLAPPHEGFRLAGEGEFNELVLYASVGHRYGLPLPLGEGSIALCE